VKSPAFLKLLQLTSPSLPVGAFSYSQGLEGAVEDGLIRDEASCENWIRDLLQLQLGRFEAPLWLRLFAAVESHDQAAFAHWNQLFLSTRESAELRAEAVQMGYSLRRLLRELGETAPEGDGPLAFVAAHAFASAAWQLPRDEALIAYLYAWTENQVLAAIKCVPLGQLAGQRMLLHLQPVMPTVAAAAATLADDELHSASPLFAITSCRHESQYSRLFRS